MAKDIYHDVVKEALIKEGWTVTHDPFTFKQGTIRLDIDLGAEIFTAEKGEEKIVVEVKSFLSKSKVTDFYEAWGKYNLYRKGLEKQGIERKLYLAVEQDIYDTFFKKN